MGKTTEHFQHIIPKIEAGFLGKNVVWVKKKKLGYKCAFPKSEAALTYLSEDKIGTTEYNICVTWGKHFAIETHLKKKNYFCPA